MSPIVSVGSIFIAVLRSDIAEKRYSWRELLVFNISAGMLWGAVALFWEVL